jgi:integration host factor subunit alpha
MPKQSRDEETDDTTVLFIRGMPRKMVARLKAAAALNQHTLGDYLRELFKDHLQDLEKKGLLPQGEIMAMDKAQIGEQIQKGVKLSGTQAAALVEFMLNLLKSTLENGEDITISGLGNFRVRNKAARQGRHPGTGEPVMITARRVVKFKANALLTAYINSYISYIVSGESGPSKGLQARAGVEELG